MEKNMDLSRLQEKFVTLVEQYRVKNDLEWKELAHQVGIKAPRISEIINFRRKLTANYVEPFIWSRIITMSELYDGKDASSKEKQFWKRMSRAERADLLDIIIRAEEAGIDVKEILLDALLKRRG